MSWIPPRRDRVALCEFIDSRVRRPHDFSGNDCVRFTLGGVKAQFGISPILPVNWTTERGARRAIVKLGGIAATCDRLFRPIAPGEAQFGDIAGVEDPLHGFHVMLVEGATLCSPGDIGLDRVPRAEMVRAWSAEPTEDLIAGWRCDR